LRISGKLSIIVILTSITVCITIWASFQIAKGAGFHRLNLLHLKYAAQYEKAINKIERGAKVNTIKLKRIVRDIKAQSIACLEEAGFLDKKLMQLIDTDYALSICEEDLVTADTALTTIKKYENKKIGKSNFVKNLKKSLRVFKRHSAQFEEPISKTVNLILIIMIPVIVLLSLFNIIFIAYLSKSITNSIKYAVTLLSSKSFDANNEHIASKNVSGELLELLNASQKRVKEDTLNLEKSDELKHIIDLQTKELKTNITKLEGANAELSQFAYRTSHDLKSPLISARGLARVIKEDADKNKFDDISNHAQLIEGQMRKLEALIESIFNLTSADLKKLDTEEVKLDSILSDIKERLIKLQTDNKVLLETDFSHTKTLNLPRARITQILENLISNGMKYCDTNKPNQFVKVSSVDTKKGVLISIEDNGLGIPQEFNNRVFGMFERFHQNTSTGSGLGMYIVKKHIDKMGADINFTSSSSGTKFEIEINLNDKGEYI